jgi:hypothetical protein
MATPPSSAGDVAGVTFAPSVSPVVPTPAPTPTPAPVAFTAFTDRLSGTWLLRQHLGADARHAGVYPRELLLEIQPACDDGPCSVTARLVDPRTDETLSTTPVALAAGYPFSIDEEHGDLCAGPDGRTVEAGATRATSFEVRVLVRSDTAETVLSVDGAGRLEPTKRGRSVDCRETAYAFEVTAEKLTEESRASVTERLTPVARPDLVPLPDFTVKLKGARMVYYPVKGTSASQLADDWAQLSSKKKYCGKIDYEWHAGSRQTTSCLKVKWTTTTTQRTNTATGSCTVVGVDLNSRFTMPIARWTGPALVPRVLVTWWKATQEYVRDHEAGHLKIDRAWFKKLKGRLDGAACSKVDAIIKKWNKQVEAAQEAYDKREYARSDWPPYPLNAP